MKAERDFGPSFLWVRPGIPSPEQDVCFEYYIIPSKDMAFNVSRHASYGWKHREPRVSLTSIGRCICHLQIAQQMGHLGIPQQMEPR